MEQAQPLLLVQSQTKTRRIQARDTDRPEATQNGGRATETQPWIWLSLTNGWLSIMDYATRYLEAVPFPSLHSAGVGRALLKHFFQVGLPWEIQIHDLLLPLY